MSAPGWPVSLSEGPVGTRPLRLRDGVAWVDLRTRNEAWLVPWEATPPGAPTGRASWAERQTLSVYGQMLRGLRRQARGGAALPFGVTYQGALAGQLTVGNIVRGAFNSAYVGYWLDEQVAGRGVTPTALALVVDHCFTPVHRGGVGLHRIEANIRPENVASRRLVDKLGFREEGLHERYLAIDGAYRDHIGYALTVEDVPQGLLARWRGVRDTRPRGR